MFTELQRAILYRNGELSHDALRRGDRAPDHEPVVHLTAKEAGCSWLFTELSDAGALYGLADYGGSIALDHIDLSELEAMGDLICIDRRFRPRTRLSEYARLAHRAGRLVL